jgi:hypothetical protein
MNFPNENLITEDMNEISVGGGSDEETQTDNEWMGRNEQRANNNNNGGPNTTDNNINNDINSSSNNNAEVVYGHVNWVLINSNPYDDIRWDLVHVPKIKWSCLVPMSVE